MTFGILQTLQYQVNTLQNDGTRIVTIFEEQEKYIDRAGEITDSPFTKLTPCLMGPGGSMPHSQGLSNNSYPEPNSPH